MKEPPHACRDLESVFAKTTEVKEEEVSTRSSTSFDSGDKGRCRPVLSTGATGWGDEDSSDEEDDDLL